MTDRAQTSPGKWNSEKGEERETQGQTLLTE